MTLFTKAENTSAYLKMGIMGRPGSGKTLTASLVAIGLVQLMRQRGLPAGDRPVYFLDTEGGSDWVAPRFAEAGIPLFTAKTKAFADLLVAVPEAEANASIMVTDSLTHFWIELCDAYMAAKKDRFGKPRTKLQFEDWAYLKGEWRKFTDAYVNSNLHCIVAGRAGYEYDYVLDDETGKKNLEKTDIKMKAEGDMGYEPSILVLMERDIDMTTKVNRHIATVLKDRAGLIDGKEFTNPTFESFLPHIERLNWGGMQRTVDLRRNSVASIPADIRDNRSTQRAIVLDEIEDLLVMHHPSTSGADKQAKLRLLRKYFDASWAEIDKLMPLERLRQGYDMLHVDLEKSHSKYHVVLTAAAIPAAATEIDELPAHSAPPAAAEAKREEVILNDERGANGLSTSVTPHTATIVELPQPLPHASPMAAGAPPPQPLSPMAAGAHPPQATDDLGGIPPFLDRRKPKNLKDRLLADIPRLATAQDLLRWSLTMSGVSGKLPKEAQDEIAAAIMVRQMQLLNSAAAH
jgi:hypothetical protein